MDPTDAPYYAMIDYLKLPEVMTSMHAQAAAIRSVLQAVSTFLQRVRTTTEQFNPADRWRAVLRFIYRDRFRSTGDPTPEFVFLLS